MEDTLIQGSICHRFGRDEEDLFGLLVCFASEEDSNPPQNIPSFSQEGPSDVNHHDWESSRLNLSSSCPLGLLALHLVREWERSPQNGLIFVVEEERRAEQLGAILYGLAPSCGVMVLPRQDTLPFDGLEPSPDVRGGELPCYGVWRVRRSRLL